MTERFYFVGKLTYLEKLDYKSTFYESSRLQIQFYTVDDKNYFNGVSFSGDKNHHLVKR